MKDVRKYAGNIRDKKIEVAQRLGFFDKEGVKDQLERASLPELIAYCFSKMSGHANIAISAAALQGFQIGRDCLYDLIADAHFIKKGIPTILNLGEQYVEEVLRDFGKAVDYLATELEERGISHAKATARRQHEDLIRFDKERSAYNQEQPKIEETKIIMDLFAGEHGRRMGELSSRDPQLAIAGEHIARAFVVLEDLRDFVTGEDLIKRKATLPLTLLAQRIPNYINLSQEKVFQLAEDRGVYRDTAEYILREIDEAMQIIQNYQGEEAELLRGNLNEARGALTEGELNITVQGLVYRGG